MKLIAVIEKGSDGGFAVCVREHPGFLGYGLTEEEAIEDFKEVFEEQCDWYKEQHGGISPEWENAEIEYRYDIAAFFSAFPFINVSKFAEYVGINPSLMRKYKQGIAFASRKQLQTIQNGIDKMVAHLKSVQI